MLSGTEIWTALVQDPRMKRNSQLFPVFRKIIDQVPAALSDLEKAPVTAETFLEASLRFLHLVARANFVLQVLAAPANESLSPERLAVIYQEMAQQQQEVLDQLTTTLGDVPAFLRQHQLSDDGLILSERTGLNETMKNRYREGKLTIGELLLRQPGVILLPPSMGDR